MTDAATARSRHTNARGARELSGRAEHPRSRTVNGAGLGSLDAVGSGLYDAQLPASELIATLIARRRGEHSS
jgi:hypothetical protein